MNKTIWLATTLASIVTFSASAVSAATQNKKRILLVTTSVGFRHPSAGFAEKSLRQMAEQSGEFEIVSTSDSPDFPKYPEPMAFETDGDPSAGPKMPVPPPGAMAAGAPGGGLPPGFPDPKAPGGAGSPEVLEQVRKVLAQYLSVEALKKYDAVIFVNTNGELPLPDPQGFLAWIKAGHGYMGTHSASDTLHTLPGYMEMIGAEFDHHERQEAVTLSRSDAKNKITAAMPQTVVARDEWYLFKSSYDQSKVHSLYGMTAHPNNKTLGKYPVAWCKQYGKGRVFYTSQGHRFDIWDAAWLGTDGQRANSPEAVAAFRASLLAAMRWTTGLSDDNCDAP